MPLLSLIRAIASVRAADAAAAPAA